jgi:serine/threonine protein kinase
LLIAILSTFVSQLDGRVDVWSFGCTLFFAMYGSNAFDADSSSVYLAAINGRLNWSGVDKERHSQQLLSVVHECLTVELPDRPTAAQIASRLRALKATFPLYSASISNSEDIP